MAGHWAMIGFCATILTLHLLTSVSCWDLNYSRNLLQMDEGESLHRQQVMLEQGPQKQTRQKRLSKGSLYTSLEPIIPSQCRLDNSSAVAAMCRCNNTELGHILGLLPVNTQRLTVQLDSNLGGHYPIPTVDLHNISHLTGLEYLALQKGYKEGNNLLRFAPDTFKYFNKLKELHINMITDNSNLGNITKHAERLQDLDLSGISHLNIQLVQNIMRSFKTTSLKRLNLRSFQMPGSSGYSDAFNVSLFFDTTLNVENLDLSRNMLGVIYPSIITIFPNLTHLDISENNLLLMTNDPLLLETLLHPTLEVLNMGNQGVGYVTNSVTTHTNVAKVSKLGGEDLDSVLQAHSTTAYLYHCINSNSGGNVSLFFAKSSIFCSALRCVGNLSPHLSQGIPCEAFGDFRDVFDSTCPYFTIFPIAKRLRSITANSLNYVSRHTPKLLRKLCLGQTALQTVSFSNNYNWIKNTLLYGFWQLTFTKTLKDLKSLNLNKNSLEFVPSGNLSKLQELYLSENSMQLPNTSLCTQYPSLRNLSVASNKLTYVFVDFISTCQYLEHLDLSRNFLNLSENQINVGNNLLLRTINLDYNTIDILPENFTGMLERIIAHQIATNMIGKLQITFDHNNLLCQCTAETMRFISWFQMTQITIYNKEYLSCTSSQGMMFLLDIDVEQLKATCFPSNVKLIAISVSITICAVLMLLIIAIIYRYRWRLQFCAMKRFNSLCRDSNAKSILQEGCKMPMKYDAFVSYCSDDRFWVHDCLMTTLESDKYGLKLCIHYRDFPLGEDISTVIVNTIRESRQLIIVLSKCSITRPWCQLEFQVALAEAVRRGIKLAVIKLGQFRIDQTVDSSVAWVLDSHTFLEWKENKHAQRLFWYKLLRHLYGDIGGCSCLGSPKVYREDVSAFANIEEESKPLIMN